MDPTYCIHCGATLPGHYTHCLDFDPYYSSGGVPDEEELIPLGNTWENEDTKPGATNPDSTTWVPFQGVEFKEEPAKKCECGARMVGGKCSDWCPLYVKE